MVVDDPRLDVSLMTVMVYRTVVPNEHSALGTHMRAFWLFYCYHPAAPTDKARQIAQTDLPLT